MSEDTGAILQAAYPRVVATLSRVLGDMERAQDATQEAMLKALKEWRNKGRPKEPVAWLVTVARNHAIDQVRRDRRLVSVDSAGSVELTAEPSESAETLHLPDDLLRLIYTCCHPVLTEETQVILTLKVVLGFSVDEVAAALLSNRGSVERRVTRAKRKLEAAGVGFAAPAVSEIPERSLAVLRVVYLLFNYGYSKYSNPEVFRQRLMEQAIRLCRMVIRLFRDNPEAKALLALMLLISARANARLDAKGSFVPLAEQDRSVWDWARIAEGKAIVDAVLAARRRPGSYQIQAAIAALHCVQPAKATDWQQIAALYDVLPKYDSSPVIAVNAAVAKAMAGDELGSWRKLSELDSDSRLKSYQPYHAACGFVLTRLGKREAAAAAYDQAIALCEFKPERLYLEGVRAALYD